MEISSDSVEVVKEYILRDYNTTKRYLIIHNLGDSDVNIHTDTLAYSADGSLVSVDDSNYYSLGAGCTSILPKYFDTDKEINSFETKMNVSTDTNMKSSLPYLSYTQHDINNGAIFQVTNNSDITIDSVEGYVLFLKDGKLTYCDWDLFSNGDYNVGPNETISRQFTSYVDYDSIEFYMIGHYSDHY